MYLKYCCYKLERVFVKPCYENNIPCTYAKSFHFERLILCHTPPPLRILLTGSSLCARPGQLVQDLDSSLQPHEKFKNLDTVYIVHTLYRMYKIPNVKLIVKRIFLLTKCAYASYRNYTNLIILVFFFIW